MKVLSIRQPWAELIVQGIKHIETRSWNTSYRGRLLIHASKSPMDREGQRLAKKYKLKNIAYGSIIGEVDLCNCRIMDFDFMGNIIQNFKEYELGYFKLHRYAWLLDAPIKYDNPVPAKGQLRLWNYKGDIGGAI